jgi:phosphoserine phosphatase
MSETGRIMSLSATGLDSPGLVSRITNRIFDLKGNILDVEENCRRGLFSIFLVIDFQASEHSEKEIWDALKEIEGETGLSFVLGVHDEQEATRLPRKENEIVTIMGEDQPGIIARVSSLFYRYNINIEALKMIARGRFFCMEMTVHTGNMTVPPALSEEEAAKRMRAELMALCKSLGQSVVIQSENMYKRMKKLVVFDVETSLFRDFSLRDFLEGLEGKPGSLPGRVDPKEAHRDDEGQELMDNALRLRGMSRHELERFGEMIQLNPGTLELIRILKSMGFKIAFLSSGFNFLMKRIFEAADVDYAFSNTLKVDEDGVITGELEEPVVTAARKDEILEFIMSVEKISSDQVIAVGDGSPRSHFLNRAGLSIAIRPDEASIKTDGFLSSDQILNMLYCFGISRTEIDQYLRKGDD